jgi:hypothetical protein
MKIKNKIIGLLIVLIISLSVFAFPQNDAEYIYLNKYYKLNNDGSWSLKYESKVKLNSYLATRRLFGETFINYNTKYQSLKIIKSETKTADGKIIPTPKNGYNEILPYNAHGFADFTHIRQMVVSHTGLERGAIEELVYIINTKKEFFGGNFFINEPLSLNIPIDKLTIVFEIPSDKELNYSLTNSSAKPIITEEGNTKKYIFKLTKVKKSGYIYPYNIKDYPYLFVSIGNTFNAIKTLFKNQKLPEDIIARIRKIAKSSIDNYDLFFKIKKYIGETIQTAHININNTGIRTRTTEKIFNSHYATPLEKTALLYSILDYCKHKPKIIIFSPVNQSGILYDTKNIFIKVTDEDNRYYINPNIIQSSFYPYDYTEYHSFNITDNKIENIKHKNSSLSFIKIYGKLYFCPKKENELTIRTKGFFNNYRQLIKSELAFVQSILNKTVGIKAEKILNTLIKTPEVFSAKIKSKDSVFTKRYDKYYFLNNFNIPEISNTDTNIFFNSLPYNFKTPFYIIYDLKLILPEHLSVDYMKDNIKIKNNLGSYIRKLRREKDGSITLSLFLSVDRDKIKDKNSLKELLNTIKNDKNLLILIKK